MKCLPVILKHYTQPIHMYDFTNKAILCETWEQMEDLARIAESQGLIDVLFNKWHFENGGVYFVRLFGEDSYTNVSEEYKNFSSCELTTYTSFINTNK